MLNNKFKETQEEENEIIMSITDKYGIGTLDPESGKFVPSDVQIKANVAEKIKEYEDKKPPVPEPKKATTSPISDALDKAVEEGKINQK